MKKISYTDAGVDIEKGNSFIQMIKPMVESTFRPEVLTKIGGFAGCVSLNLERYKKPILVSSTDGVGTKLKIAFLMDRHDTVGIDLVAMCVNDILVSGARPLFLLDYLATSHLETEKAKKVVEGIVRGCIEAECSLVGGETAEMPGFYREGEYDLAGFVVGIVEDAQLIDGSSVTVGDKLIGIASSGLHSNGYSLVRKVLLDHHKMDLEKRVEEIGGVLGEELLRPTKIYVKTVLNLVRDFKIGGMAHITGGGITGNVPRVIPKGCKAIVRKGSWEIPSVFSFLKEKGDIPEDEMLRTFNNGIGMVIIVKTKEAGDILGRLNTMGEKAFVIGEIGKAEKEQESIEFIWSSVFSPHRLILNIQFHHDKKTIIKKDLEPESAEIGAEETLKIAKMDRIQKAYLKERSPSCGTPRIVYMKKQKSTSGGTAALLMKEGIEAIGVY